MTEESIKEAQEIYKAYYRAFNTEDGKLVLDDLIQNYHNRNSFVQGDPYCTSFNEGTRRVVLDILACITKGENPVEEKEDEE